VYENLARALTCCCPLLLRCTLSSALRDLQVLQSVLLEVVVGLEARVKPLQVLECGDPTRVVSGERRTAQALAQDLVTETLAGWVEDGAEDAALDLSLVSAWPRAALRKKTYLHQVDYP
jgi:hypothetical protein